MSEQNTQNAQPDLPTQMRLQWDHFDIALQHYSKPGTAGKLEEVDQPLQSYLETMRDFISDSIENADKPDRNTLLSVIQTVRASRTPALDAYARETKRDLTDKHLEDQNNDEQYAKVLARKLPSRRKDHTTAWCTSQALADVDILRYPTYKYISRVVQKPTKSFLPPNVTLRHKEVMAKHTAQELPFVKLMDDMEQTWNKFADVVGYYANKPALERNAEPIYRTYTELTRAFVVHGVDLSIGRLRENEILALLKGIRETRLKALEKNNIDPNNEHWDRQHDQFRYAIANKKRRAPWINIEKCIGRYSVISLQYDTRLLLSQSGDVHFEAEKYLYPKIGTRLERLFAAGVFMSPFMNARGVTSQRPPNTR